MLNSYQAKHLFAMYNLWGYLVMVLLGWGTQIDQLLSVKDRMADDDMAVWPYGYGYGGAVVQWCSGGRQVMGIRI